MEKLSLTEPGHLWELVEVKVHSNLHLAEQPALP